MNITNRIFSLFGLTHYFENEKRQISLRFWRRKTQVNSGEFYIRKRPRLLPELYVYQTGGDNEDGPGSAWRMSVGWLFFHANFPVWRSKKSPIYKMQRGREKEWLPAEGEWDGNAKKYGFYFMDARCLWIRHGYGHIAWDLPFVSLVFLRHERLSLDGRQIVWTDAHGKFLEEYDAKQAVIAQHSKEFDYKYVLKSGEVQKVKATVNVERRWWRRKWTPFKFQKTCISINFSEEVGEERGSWKGGCVGCGWDMKRGETAEQCLRRMEATRKFTR